MSKEEKRVDDILLYTDITFKNDDMAVILKNVDLDMLSNFDDKVGILQDILYGKWYMNGLYDMVDILGYNFTIVNKTKTKVEMVRSN